MMMMLAIFLQLVCNDNVPECDDSDSGDDADVV